MSQVPQPPEAQQFVEGESVVKKERGQDLETRTAEPSNDKATPEETESMSTESIAPAPVKTEVVHRRRLSGVIWANPRPIPESVPEPIQEASSRPDVDLATPETENIESVQNSSTSKEVYVLQKGEGLFSVIKTHKVGNYHPAQIAVAIWMQNIDKFIFGNIHGIQAGVQLDLKNLEEIASGIDIKTARNILKDQAVEWQLTRKATSSKEEVSTIAEIPLPSERLENLDDLFKQVQGWQATWKKMDIEGHLAYYQALKPENPSLISKKRLLARYPEPSLATSSKFLVLKEGIPTVFFTQAFSSGDLNSLGLKELEWDRSASGWKIRGENFYKWPSHSEEQTLKSEAEPKDIITTAKALSFVIHVSSQSKKSLAVSLANRLRENGFDAYWTPVRMSVDTFIYRVYVGRFSSWDQAHRVVRLLRTKPFGGHATAIPYPFALQAGEFKSLSEARELLESLRKTGLSGLLLVSHSEVTGTYLRVVVGAFKKAGNASWMLQQLKQYGFAGELVTP